MERSHTWMRHPLFSDCHPHNLIIYVNFMFAVATGSYSRDNSYRLL